MNAELQKKIKISVEQLSSINKIDLADLCNITEQAIKAGGGFGWLKVPPRDILNKYWKGIILIQNSKLIVGRLNHAIAGALQIKFQSNNNEAQQNIINKVTELDNLREELVRMDEMGIIVTDLRSSINQLELQLVEEATSDSSIKYLETLQHKIVEQQAAETLEVDE